MSLLWHSGRFARVFVGSVATRFLAKIWDLFVKAESYVDTRLGKTERKGWMRSKEKIGKQGLRNLTALVE